MPEQLTDIADAVGKTIAKATHSRDDSWISLLFADGDYLLIDAHTYGDDNESSLYLELWGQDFDAERQASLGLISLEEYNRVEAEKKRIQEAQQEIEDRRIYERLKAKFEPEAPR